MGNINTERKQMQKDKQNTKSSSEKNLVKCDVCGEYHDKSITHGFNVKGKKKYICQGCADTIHGLV
jgi:transposase-like protein